MGLEASNNLKGKY